MKAMVRIIVGLLALGFWQLPAAAQNTLDKAGLTAASPAAVAYSVRQLSSSYTGKALQVRRSSDNTTQDIGFTTNGDLDTTALKTFVGSGNGYVTTWYDQSGNGRNATQTTLSQQPAIVINGVVQRANTQPAVVFDGISQTMASSAFGTITQPFTRNIVVSSNAGNYGTHILNSVGANPNTALYFPASNNVTLYAGISGGPQQNLSTATPIVLSEEYNASNSYITKNGTSSTNFNPGTNGVNGIQIASYNGSGYYAKVAISEITLFPQALTNSNRQALEINQSNYFNPQSTGNLILGISTASAAYSVRLLSTSYAGKALQVRRSSDNTTQDIGFTNNGDLDTAALKTFVGSGNGYVTTWYDQSGNGRNATQATTSKQPAIVLNGVVQRANTQPAVVFDGISQTMASSAFGTITQPFTRNIVVSSNAGNYGTHILNSVGANPNTALYFPASNNVTLYAGISGGPQQNLSTATPTVLSEEYNASNSYITKNGTSSTNFNPGTNSVNGIQIASYNGSGYYAKVAISEITLFPQALTNSNRQALEINQSNYYSITVSGNTLWTGSVNNDWNTAGNWSNGIPSATVSATIPNVAPNPFPVISVAAQVNNLTINSGAILTLNNSLQIGGNWVNNGTLTNNNTLSIAGNLSNSSSIGGTVVLNGTTDQNLRGTGTYTNLTLNNTGGSLITLNNNIRITQLLTITAGTLNLNNSDITLGSSNIANTAQVGPLGGNIIYPGTGRFVVERIIAKANGSLDSNYYRTLTAPVISDQSIWANWQEGATTANYNPNPGYGTTITGEVGISQGNDPSTGIDYSGSGRPSLWYWDINTQNYTTIGNTKSENLYGYKGYTLIIQGDRTYNLFDANAPSTFNSVTLRSRGKLLTGNIIVNSNSGASYQLGGSNTFTDNSYKLSNLADTGYTLVGNPYASAIDFTAAMANAGTSGLVTTQYGYWDGTIKQYVTWDAITGPNYAGSAATKYIQSGQSFFLQNDASSNPRQFIVTEANKNTNPANLTGVFAQQAPMAKLYLTLSNAKGQVRDGALLAQRNDFSNQSRIGEDAHKFRNPAENIAFRAQGSNWSIQKIQELAMGDTLPIRLWNLTPGAAYTLQLTGQALPQGWALYDAFSHKTHELAGADSIAVAFTPTADTTTYLNRFSIVRVQALATAGNGLHLSVQSNNGVQQLVGTATATLALTGPDYVWERSTDSLQFQAIGQSSAVHDTLFSFTDAYSGNGNVWYRIRALAADHTLYSNTVKVDANPVAMGIQVYPNPSDGQSIALRTTGLPVGLYRVNLYNGGGQLVWSNTLTLAVGNTAQALQWNGRLAAGTYYLQVQSATQARIRFTETVIIQNH